MAKLTTGERKSIPSSKFGLPGERAYPMPDRSHAANAKARASQQLKAGHLTASEKAKIDAKANALLGASHSSKPSTGSGGGKGKSTHGYGR